VITGTFLVQHSVRSLRLFCAIGLIALAGCGGGLGKLEPVEGKISVGGQPLTAGDVTFHPEDAKLKATIVGKVGSDGAYKMTTNGKPGVPKGKYKVTVTTIVLSGGTGDPGAMKPGGPAASTGPPKRQANEKYESVGTSGLSVDVPGGNYTFQLEK